MFVFFVLSQGTCLLWSWGLRWRGITNWGMQLVNLSRLRILLSLIVVEFSALLASNSNYSCSAWSKWSAWSKCSAKCGPGQTKRSRKCKSGAKGSGCSGESSQTKRCLEKECASEWRFFKLQIIRKALELVVSEIKVRITRFFQSKQESSVPHICFSQLMGLGWAGGNGVGENNHDESFITFTQCWKNRNMDYKYRFQCFSQKILNSCTLSCGPGGSRTRGRSCTAPAFGGRDTLLHQPSYYDICASSQNIFRQELFWAEQRGGKLQWKSLSRYATASSLILKWGEAHL